MSDHIISFDIGTSAVKAALTDENCRIIDSVSSYHKTYSELPGHSEHDPDEWFSGLCRTARQLTERNEDAARHVSAIGVSGIMLGCVPVDIEGNHICRAMIHSDIRATEQFRKLDSNIDRKSLYEMTGNISEPRSVLCKIMWIRDNLPQIYKKTAFFIQAKDYAVSKMTGISGITDFSDASHAQVLDINKGCYSETVLENAEIDRKKLPELRKGTEIAGYLTEAAAALTGLKQGIPVVTGAGDGACSVYGAGVNSEGAPYCCLGTTAWISALSPKPYIDPGMALFNILSPDNTGCGVYGTVQSAGKSFEWLTELFGFEGINAMITASEGSEEGADGLLFLPYLEGERTPVFDSSARGVFFGITPAHNRCHFSRAVLEGVSFALRSVLEAFPGHLKDKGPLRLIGGGARSAAIRKVITDVLGMATAYPEDGTEYATSLGAAMTAGVGTGIFKSFSEAASRIRMSASLSPFPEKTAVYDKSYEIYSSLYPALRNIFQKLN